LMTENWKRCAETLQERLAIFSARGGGAFETGAALANQAAPAMKRAGRKGDGSLL